jgi:hypothetical protein
VPGRFPATKVYCPGMTTIIPGGGWVAVVPVDDDDDREASAFLETPIVAWMIEPDGTGRPIIADRRGSTKVFEGLVFHPDQHQREVPPSVGSPTTWGRRASS